MTFSGLALCEPIQRAVAAANYTIPTPIQAAAIPHLLLGRDLLGCAQTGTGKTAAFALPILHHLHDGRHAPAPHAPQALVLSPTRELAAQIGESFQTYGRFLRVRHSVIFGGVGQHAQVRALARGVHVLVATPGRLLDLMGQKHVRLDRVGLFVLDEADRMLDMGFLPDIRRIVAALPRRRQSLFFSATMPRAVAELAGTLLTDPVKVAVTPVSSTVERIEQRVLMVSQTDKCGLLHRLLQDAALDRVLVFTRTKRRADIVARRLRGRDFEADAIHGNKSQNARERALKAFAGGRLRVLVATDVAARGLDVDGISHVINYDLPHEPECYVHRIGRTGRAGAAGVALSFCAAEERNGLRAIERLIRQTIPLEQAGPSAAGEERPDVPARSEEARPRRAAHREPAASAPHSRRRKPRRRVRTARP